MKVLMIIVLLVIAGCDREELRVIKRNEYVCETDTKKERVDFILQCIANANPKSDEEPEDWITKCEDMAKRTICELKTVEITQVCGQSSGCMWYEVSRKVAD